MGFPNVDPNAVREQQQLGRMLALKQAKNASAISMGKTLIIVVPILIVALFLVLFFSGVFDRGYTIWWNDRLYRISDELNEDLVYELPDGYAEAGTLVYEDKPGKTKEDLSSDWTMEPSCMSTGLMTEQYISRRTRDILKQKRNKPSYETKTMPPVLHGGHRVGLPVISLYRMARTISGHAGRIRIDNSLGIGLNFSACLRSGIRV